MNKIYIVKELEETRNGQSYVNVKAFSEKENADNYYLQSIKECISRLKDGEPDIKVKKTTYKDCVVFTDTLGNYITLYKVEECELN